MRIITSMAFPIFASAVSAGGQQEYDAVLAGKQIFESIGCAECHSVEKNDTSLKSGPNLYGLFLTEPRDREVMVKGVKQKIKANQDYFNTSIRKSWDALAVSESGPTLGVAYPALMPPYAEQIVSNEDLGSLWHYLRTLASGDEAGPAQVMLQRKLGPVETNPLKIAGEEVVDKTTRIVRAPIKGLSARALHVGQSNGISYSYDPRLLGVRQVWSGGFINLREERNSRAKSLSTLGKGAEVHFEKGVILAPITAKGEVIDFEFKEPDAHDYEAIEKNLWDGVDFDKKLAKMPANYLGYELQGEERTPTFKVEVGENTYSQTITFERDGMVKVTLSGDFKTDQMFRFAGNQLNKAEVTGGTLINSQWTIPAGQKGELVFTARLDGKFVEQTPLTGAESFAPQPLVILPAKPGRKPLQMPIGYTLKDWIPPIDMFGREQIFEPTGIAVAKDGTIVLTTRAAGIWRIRNNEWSLFAEGIYEGLGVVIEDDHGDVIVIAQKPEITRIKDIDGDGRADTFDTMTDDFGFHGNYHEYTHGPARDSEGNYYFLLNLSHDNSAKRVSWTAGGKFMGSMGGYRGWACRVTPEGKFETFAHGLRSPAGLATGPDGRIWYTENQGEYAGSSKIVPLEKGKYYGNIAGLIDLPGMGPDAPELNYDAWIGKLRKGAVWLPHAMISNSPGSPVWDLTGGKFGPFENQIFLGDQTLSKVMRVTTEQVDGIDQGAVMPFVSGLTSGIMRPVFLPDGSLLLGQTGRGWGALGGQQSGLQQVVYDGSTLVSDLKSITAAPRGFTLHFTKPLKDAVTGEELMKQLDVESWFYSNFADYGSPRRDKRPEVVTGIEISEDKLSAIVSLRDFGIVGKGGIEPDKMEAPKKAKKPSSRTKDKRTGNRDWLDRVFYLKLKKRAEFLTITPGAENLEGFYTLRKIPAK